MIKLLRKATLPYFRWTVSWLEKNSHTENQKAEAALYRKALEERERRVLRKEEMGLLVKLLGKR